MLTVEDFVDLATSSASSGDMLDIVKSLPPPRVIFDREGGSPYLSRWYLSGRPAMPDGSEPFTELGQPREGAIFPGGDHQYIHRFHRSDDDGALHNHPWESSTSIVLVGGYAEERRASDDSVQRRTVRPGNVNHIAHDTYHRVDLLDVDAWSLFFAGPKAGTWGFWDRDTHEFTDWRAFIAKKRGLDLAQVTK